MKKEFELNECINGLYFIGESQQYVSPAGRKVRVVELRCFCGKIFTARLDSVKSGNTKSCGCLIKVNTGQANTKHGFWDDPLYKTWLSQKSRCLNPKATGYANWGGRGIRFSEEFLDIKNWMNYVKSLPNYEKREKENLTLDRINNDGNYEKGNLRWVSRSVQNKNRRS